MTDPQNDLQRFIAGEITASDFEQLLYANADVFEKYLSQDPNLKRSNNYVGSSVFHYLLNCNFTTPTGNLNAIGAIRDYFERNQIPYKIENSASKLHKFVLSSLPSYVNADIDWIVSRYCHHAEWNDVLTSKDWLKRKIEEDFPFVSKPPKWIQSPAWPIKNNCPLVFFGQIPLEKYFHDKAAVYVFYDRTTGSCENVIQVM
jgi:hypothetical protein